MQAFLKEFKAFAVRGNVVDLAVAVVIGGAFGKIVSSLVDKVIMPILSFLTGGVDLSGMTIVLRVATGDKAALVLGYGAFLQSVIDFLIIAFVIFIVIKQMNRFILKTKEEEKVVEEPKPSDEVVLLAEIRDLLRKG